MQRRLHRLPGLVGLILGLNLLCAPLESHAAGRVLSWGLNSNHQTEVPFGLTNVIAVAAGEYHSLALRDNGTVIAWGSSVFGETNVPPGLTNVIAIAGGEYRSLALKSDGTVVGWGINNSPGITAGLSNVVAIALGWQHGLALRANGTLVMWEGDDYFRQTYMPPGLTNVVAIACGTHHSLALKADGKVVAWGYNQYGQINVPSGLSNVVAIAGGSTHSMALKADGTLVTWGTSSQGEGITPAGLSNVIGISSGVDFSVAIRSNGTVAAWGRNQFGQTNVPPNLASVSAVASGYGHTLALTDGSSHLMVLPARTVVVGTTVSIVHLFYSGAVAPLSQWKFNGTNLPAATNSTLIVTNVQLAQAGIYSVVATNDLGIVATAEAVLDVVPLLITNQPQSMSVFSGTPVTFNVAAVGQSPFSYQWQFNGTNLPAETNSTLLLPNARLDQAGTYRVVVSNQHGAGISSEAVLDVVPLLITNQPQSKLVFRGAPVTFNVAPAGPAPFSYQWQFNGTNLPAETNSTLLLSNARLDQAGIYNVVVSNLFGTVISTDAVLSVSLLAEWGNLEYGQTPQPPGLTNVVAIASASYSQMALKQDGTVIKWGDFGDTNVPPDVTNVVAIAVGSSHSLALKADGKVTAWGENGQGQCNVPAGLFGVEAIAAGGEESCALKSDGSVVVWGSVDPGSPLPEMRNVTAVSGYVYTSDGFFSEGLALRHDGTVVAWARNNYGETNVPPVPVPPGLSNVVAIAGSGSPLALKADGTVVAWGYNGQGQTNVPPGLSNVVAIASGGSYQLAVKADGTVVAWGYSYYGETNVPASLSNVVAVSAGSYRSMALVGDGSPFITIAPRSRSVNYGGNSSLFVAAAGTGLLQYQWKFNGTNLPAGTNATLVLSAVQFNQSGTYSVVVSNVLGTATHELVLNVVPALITSQSPGQITFRGATVTFQVTAEGPAPLSYQWKFAGADLPGQTNSMLVMTNVQFQQAGAYSVVVGSALGSVTGTDINLSVGRIAAWGESRHGQLRLPGALTNVLAVAGGEGHSLALKTDGTVVGWGYNYYGQASPPPGLSNVVAIAAGDYHSMALKSDGTVVVWGNNSYGQLNVPPGLSNVVAIATSPYVNFALKADGTVGVWGVDYSSLGNLPSDLTNVVAIGAGYYQGAALKATGDIVVWGPNNTAPTNTGYVQAISVSKYNHGIALKADGAVAVWNSLPDAPATLSNVVAIASGNAHALALDAAGSVVAWGDNPLGQTNVPAGLANVAAIAGGSVHSLALVGDNPPVTQAAGFDSRWSTNAFRLTLPSQSGRVYRPEYRSSLVGSNWTALPLAAGNGGVIVITDSTATNAQRFYRIRQW